eukprot:c27708_g1_i4 orf=721-2085(-)
MEVELATAVNDGHQSGLDSVEKSSDEAPLLSPSMGSNELEVSQQKEDGFISSEHCSEVDDLSSSQIIEDSSQWHSEGTEDKAPLLSTVQKEGPVDKDAAVLRNGMIVSSEDLNDLEMKCEPYVRHDIYGTMGKGDISVWEKALIALSLLTIVPIKLILLLTILIAYYLICRVCTLFKSPLKDEGQENYSYLTGWRKSIIVCSGRFLARTMLFVLGFYWITVTHRDFHPAEKPDEDNCKGKCMPQEDSQRPGAIISNHVSYLDILYHLSASFPSFVAKRSVAKLPFVGLISKCLGCVYVQREAKSSNFKGVSAVVADRLRAAHFDPNAPVMMLFPEGTTTNGGFLLPFKTGAFLSQTPVQPVILKYPYRRFSPAWDTISGIRHLILLLCQFVNHLEVMWLPVYVPSEKEKHDPKLYANNVRALMAVEGGLTLSNIGLFEKRIYHAALDATLQGHR